eukprot:TRINITY_DN7396_c0_g1_i1.p2 TRINITY_DN7396_c0_g1~~TRINITY_DN7396_c0_g1_i1.p2  ORF type:complete len:351 (-),score=91.40 TRINITY_DN7396_c0_g1_i1:574-1626(-)
MLEKFFLMKDTSNKEGEDDDGKKKKDANATVNLLDIKRANNVGILLSRIKATPAAIRKAIETLDENALSLDNSKSLLKLAPTDEEKTTLKEYQGDRAKLGVAEQFFLEMLKIPRLVPRVESMIYRREFYLKLAELKEDIKMINLGALEVAKSSRLRNIMQLVLALGNIMNQGSYAADCTGFKISSMLKIKDVKSSKGQYNLLNYLCNLIEARKPSVLQLPEQMPHVKPGAKDRMGLIVADLSNLKKGMEVIEEELKNATAENDEVFLRVIGKFAEKSRIELKAFEKSVQEMTQGFEDLAAYFGEDKGVDVLSIVNEFVRDLSSAIEDNAKVRKQWYQRRVRGESICIVRC